MAEYAIAQASSVDTFERVRQALSGLLAPVSPLNSRSGILDNGGVVTLTTGMSVSVSAFRAFIDGTSSATQAGYLAVLDAAKTLTFADGGASNRTDIIVARVYDNVYDATGQTKFSVEIVQGVGGGGVPATPANAIKLAEKVITAGMSAGTGGLGTAPTDKRPPRAVAVGGLIPVVDQADRDSLAAYAARHVFRLDTLDIEYHDGTAWRVLTARKTAYKAASQIVNNSTAVAADNDLKFNAAANAVYLCEFTLLFDTAGGSASNMDAKVGMSLPAGATWAGGVQAPDVALASGSSVGNMESRGVTGAVAATISIGISNSFPTLSRFSVYVKTGANAGQIALTWAQNTAVAFNLTLLEGSSLKYERVA